MRFAELAPELIRRRKKYKTSSEMRYKWGEMGYKWGGMGYT